MYLDQRSKNLLEILVKNPSLSSKNLETKMELSRRQIRYSVDKINDWLEDNNYPKIERLKNGKFVINPILSELFMDQELINHTNYILSEEERVLLILYIMLSQDDLSLFHFTVSLKVSNVTILSDMKKAKQKIIPYHLNIVYSRVYGYKITGNEWDKRNLLQHIVQEIYQYYGGLTLLQDFTTISEKDLNDISRKLEEIETFLNIVFTDERMQLLPYLLVVIFERIKRGKIIEFDYQIKHTELSDTKEYIATEKLVNDSVEFPEVERLYITLQILSTNIFSNNALTETRIPQLKEVLEEFLKNFERNSFIQLKNKDYLVSRLMIHIKPAYYRIKYNLSSYHQPTLQLDKAYIELDQLVKKSLGPLESFLNTEIPDHERLFITIFIGGHLIETNQTLSTRKKAIIVCRNGVTIAKLLRNTLTKLFPEFDFYPTMSVREFNNMTLNTNDIVFSPEPVETAAEVFIVQTLLSEADKWNLRQRVLQRIYGVSMDSINIDKIMNIIKESTNVVDEKKLRSDLQQYFVSANPIGTFSRENETLHLSDFMTTDRIIIKEKVSNWKEAVQIASTPLLTDHSITPTYVRKMIEEHDFENPYMILGTEMAIPHTEAKYGVNRSSMSMLIVKNGVQFAKDLTIHFIVVIASTGTEEHVTAINQLSNLAMDKKMLREILCLNNNKAVYEELREFLLNNYSA